MAKGITFNYKSGSSLMYSDPFLYMKFAYVTVRDRIVMSVWNSKINFLQSYIKHYRTHIICMRQFDFAKIPYASRPQDASHVSKSCTRNPRFSTIFLLHFSVRRMQSLCNIFQSARISNCPDSYDGIYQRFPKAHFIV